MCGCVSMHVCVCAACVSVCIYFYTYVYAQTNAHRVVFDVKLIDLFGEIYFYCI